MVGNGNANGIPFINKHTDAIKPIAWYDIKKQGCTNESLSNNPVLIDLSGNGHNLTLNNFAFSGMSGVGGYVHDIINLIITSTSKNSVNIIGNKITLIDKTLINSPGWTFVTSSDILGEVGQSININIPAFKIKVSGLPNEVAISYNYSTSTDSKTSFKWSKSMKIYNGITEIPAINITLTPDNETNYCTCCPCRLMYSELAGVESFNDITIEILPEYPDALVFDGVDDNATCTNMPILNDFTFIYNAKKLNNTIVDGNIEVYGIAFSKRSNGYEVNGAFVFSKRYNRTESIYNYGSGTNIETIIEDGINYVKKGIFNDKTINVGTLSDSNNFMIGSLFPTYEYGNMVFYSCALFGKSLTDTQIKDWVRKNIDKDYLLPSERPKPNIYYDFRNGDNSNLTTVTDLSGNERHGTMYNFTGEADSGYSDGCLKFNGIDNYIQIPYSDDAVYKTVILLVRPSLSKGENMIYDGRYAKELTTGIALFYATLKSNYLSGRLSDNAKVYINGVINTSYTNADMNGKKNCVAVSDDVPYSGTIGSPPNIGAPRFASNWFAYMELYAFLGFDKILTEEEIKYVMNKYNLLEDIDEI